MTDDSALVFTEAGTKVENSRAVREHNKDPVTHSDKILNRLVGLKLDFSLDFLLGVIPNVQLRSRILMVLTRPHHEENIRLAVWLDKGGASRYLSINSKATACSFVDSESLAGA
jgi:hypothetical protein